MKLPKKRNGIYIDSATHLNRNLAGTDSSVNLHKSNGGDQERLGHKDDETTKNVYLHVTKTMKKEASQKFGELMRRL